MEAQARKLHEAGDALGRIEERNLRNSSLVEEVAASSASLSERAARLGGAAMPFRLDAGPASRGGKATMRSIA